MSSNEFDNLSPAEIMASAIAGEPETPPEATPAPGTGNAETPPAAGQPGAADEAPPSEVTDDDLLGDFDDQLGAASESNPEQLATRYAASSKEAKRLTSNHEAINADLEKQGLEVMLDDKGTYVGVRAVGSSADKEAPAPPSIEGALGDLLVTDAEAAVKQIWTKAQDAFASYFAQATATVEAVSKPPSVESLETANTNLTAAKNKLGEARYPDVAENAAVVSQMVERLPAELREAYNEHPQLVLGLLHDRAARARQQMLDGSKAAAAEAEKKKKDAQASANLSPTGDSSIYIGNEAGGAEDQMADMIAKSL